MKSSPSKTSTSKSRKVNLFASLEKLAPANQLFFSLCLESFSTSHKMKSTLLVETGKDNSLAKNEKL